ncbi:MAG: hypothetical protein KDC56_02155 [Flavobacteriaceae bacterium]|nr:hypothetical protein [Flavobacteriaceae bacterium]
MKKILLLTLCGLYFSHPVFSQEKVNKTYYYTSPDSKGYISFQKTEIQRDTINEILLNTRVKATFRKEEPLDFSLSTTNDSDKMIAPSKIVFDGTIEAQMDPVHFQGERIKKGNKEVAYWQFSGDYSNERPTADVRQYLYPKYNATLRLPDRTIPSFNLWAIIPKLDFDRAGTFKYNELDETKLRVSKNQTVNYLGKFETNINGQSQELHKFVLQGKGKAPSYFWVNDDRELLKVQLDDNRYTFTLASKEDALKNSVE